MTANDKPNNTALFEADRCETTMQSELVIAL